MKKKRNREVANPQRCYLKIESETSERSEDSTVDGFDSDECLLLWMGHWTLALCIIIKPPTDRNRRGKFVGHAGRPPNQSKAY